MKDYQVAQFDGSGLNKQLAENEALRRLCEFCNSRSLSVVHVSNVRGYYKSDADTVRCTIQAIVREGN